MPVRPRCAGFWLITNGSSVILETDVPPKAFASGDELILTNGTAVEYTCADPMWAGNASERIIMTT